MTDTIPLSRHLETAIASAKTAVNVVSAKHHALPLPPHFTPGDPGSIAAAMMTAAARPSDSVAIVKAVSRIRKETKAVFTEAEKCIAEMRARSEQWLQIAEALEGKRATTSLGLDAHTEGAVFTVQRALQGGLIEPREVATLCAEIRRDHQAAEAQIDEATDTLERIKSAAGIALANNAARAYRERSKRHDDMFAKLARSHEAVGRTRKVTHAHKYYDRHLWKKTIGGIERRMAGVEVGGR